MVYQRSLYSFLRLRLPIAVAIAVLIIFTTAETSAHEGREAGEIDLVVGFLHEPAFEAQPNAAYIKLTKPGVDLISHGGLFGSGPVESGSNFEFEIQENLQGLEIPFHDHLSGESGTITVSHDGEVSGTAMVQFDGTFSPNALNVTPGTTLMFMNVSSSQIMTVVSGLHEVGDNHDHDHGDGTVVDEPVLGLASNLQVEVTHIPTGEQKTMEVRPLLDDPGGYVADFVPTAPGAYTFRFFGEVEGEPFDEAFTSGPSTFDEVVPSRSVQFPIELRETRELQGAVEGLQTELTLATEKADDADSAASTALLIGIVGIVVGIIGVGIGGYGMTLARRKS